MNSYKFSIVVEKDKDLYFAFCPDLQGCHVGMLWGSWGKIKVIWYMEGKSILLEVEKEVFMRHVGIDAHKDCLQVAITDEKGKILKSLK